MNPRERRHAGRQPKRIRFRFEVDGVEHRAVTTSVGPRGGHAKASYVPPIGARVILEEVYGRGRARVRATVEVAWSVERPTLEQPETGFGFRLVALHSPDGPEAIADTLRFLDPSWLGDADVQVAEADGETIHTFYAPEQTSEADGGHGDDDATEEEPAAVDLSVELERMARRESRRAARPHAGDADAAEGGDGAEGAPGGDEAGDPPPRDRTRRRLSGIISAIFGKKGDG